MQGKKSLKQKLLISAPVLALCAILAVMTAANIHLVVSLLRSCVSRDRIAFDGITDRIASAFQSDELFGKNTFININGLFMRLAGRETDNEVDLMKDDMLTTYYADWDMENQIQVLTELSDALVQLHIPFTYVQAPGKMPLDKSLLRSYHEDSSNENADALLRGLKQNGVNALDLRPFLCQDEAQVERYFYKTDHHWNADGAFVAFEQVMSHLDALLARPLDKKYVDALSWTRHEIPDIFLGSSGKRVGVFYGGVDDLIYYTPNFHAELSCAIPNHRELRVGEFEETTLWNEYVENKDYFNRNNYYVYFGGDYPIMSLRNAAAPNQERLLVVKDSFGIPLLAFLQTEFREVEVLDPRYFRECSLVEYIDMYRPDAVLMVQNPSTLGNEDFYNNCGGDAFVEDSQQERREALLLDVDEVVLRPSDNQYNSYKVPVRLTPGNVYTISIGDIEVTSGNAEAVMASVYAPDPYALYNAKLWDYKYEKKCGSFTWSFMCPVGYDRDDLELRIYSGISGAAQGIGMKFRSIRVTEKYAASGLRTVFAGEALELTAAPKDYNNQAVYSRLAPGKMYEVSADDLMVEKGYPDGVSVGVLSTSAGNTVLREDWIFGKMCDGKYRWRFIVPTDIDSEDEYKVQFFAGIAGETEDIGIRVVHPVVSEVVGPYGEEVLCQGDVEIAAADNDYQSYALPLSFEAGETYTVRARDIVGVEGEVTALTAALYRADLNRFIGERVWQLDEPDGDGFTWTFTVPTSVSEASQCRLMLYAGVAGSTWQKGVHFDNLSVYRAPSAMDGAIVFSEDELEVVASDSAYNCLVVPCRLAAGRSYQLEIRDYELLSGSTEGFSIKLHSNISKQDVDEKKWWINNGRYVFQWIFTMPEDMVGFDEITLQLCAGFNGQTSGIGVRYKKISIREIK